MEVVNLVAPERVESGTAGASARRELERRKAKGDVGSGLSTPNSVP
jgi:hypothetical protein